METSNSGKQSRRIQLLARIILLMGIREHTLNFFYRGFCMYVLIRYSLPYILEHFGLIFIGLVSFYSL